MRVRSNAYDTVPAGDRRTVIPASTTRAENDSGKSTEGYSYKAFRRLTYNFRNFDVGEHLDEALVKAIFREAFAKWGDVINIDIQLDAAATSPNFWIGWFRHHHEINGVPCQSFDGHGGDTAHAFPPGCGNSKLAGECHFDGDESWEATNGPLVLNLNTIALHEIGHLLGLAAHSETRGDVMYGHYRGMGRELSRNDVAAMRRLYGLRLR